nr:MAG TPA: IMPORTIN BETA-1 SUBUNIT, NUCLEOPORIN NUP1 TRANSPORT, NUCLEOCYTOPLASMIC TRANSPORT, NUCLEAR.99A [Caudoviricetes sp.]
MAFLSTKVCEIPKYLPNVNLSNLEGGYKIVP